MTKTLPFLGITLGDPAGAGPSLGVAAALDPRLRSLCRPILIGDAWVVQRFSFQRGLGVNPIVELDGNVANRPGTVNVFHVPHPHIRTLTLGRPQKVAGEAAGLSIRCAAALAMQKRLVAVVTGPVSKESLQLAGIPFRGHTEMLAAFSGVKHVEMVMSAGKPSDGHPLIAVLVTRHIPLKEVPLRLSKNLITAAVRRVDPWLRKALRLRSPGRWAVCGLNPHAGDNGLLGTEEKRLVAPAIESLRRNGLRVDGPLPADAAWAKHVSGEYEAIACLYHDQAMIPLKTLHPNRVVNITVGLPWIRTSPGHGTAYDLAADRKPFSKADPAATLEAAFWALHLAGITH